MRLVKIGLGSIDTTVGAFRANIDRALGARPRDGGRRRHRRASSRSRSSAATRSRTWSSGRASSSASGRSWSASRAETAELPTVFVIGVSVLHDGLRYNCAAVVAGGPDAGRWCRRRSCRPTTSSTRGGPSPAACPGMARGAPRRALRRSPLPLRLRHDRARGLRGPLEPGRADQAPHLLRRRAGLQHLRLAVPAGRGADAARADRHPRRRPPVHASPTPTCVGANDGLIFDGGGFVNQNGKWMLEAPRWREGFAAAVVDLDRTARLRAENTTWRDRRGGISAPDARAGADHRRAGRRRSARAASRAALTYPVPAHGSLLPARDPAPRPIAARGALRGHPRRAGAGRRRLLREEPAPSSMIGVALSGGRDSLLTLLIAHRYASRVRPGRSRARCCGPSTCRRRYSSAETRRAAETICRELGVPLEIVPIDEAFERELAATRGDARTRGRPSPS